jgi:hypothetical protein
MYRAPEATEDYEPAGSLVASAIVPDALIAVGVLSLIMAVLVVSCHLYRLFARRDAHPVFVADDKLILTYFYGLIIVFAAVAVS